MCSIEMVLGWQSILGRIFLTEVNTRKDYITLVLIIRIIRIICLKTIQNQLDITDFYLKFKKIIVPCFVLNIWAKL